MLMAGFGRSRYGEYGIRTAGLILRSISFGWGPAGFKATGACKHGESLKNTCFCRAFRHFLIIFLFLFLFHPSKHFFY